VEKLKIVFEVRRGHFLKLSLTRKAHKHTGNYEISTLATRWKAPSRHAFGMDLVARIPRRNASKLGWQEEVGSVAGPVSTSNRCPRPNFPSLLERSPSKVESCIKWIRSQLELAQQKVKSLKEHLYQAKRSENYLVGQRSYETTAAFFSALSTLWPY